MTPITEIPGIDRVSWVCPTHRTPLRAEDQWRCGSGCTFAAQNKIARFVPESGYADAFGTQWNRWRTTQLDSHSGTSISCDRLAASLGPELFGTLAGRTVLEVGCGAGRFTEILLAEGAFVVSVDLSSAVDANAENAPVSSHHVVAQADVTQLPFAPEQFDLVLALGMVQHTPDPQRTVAALTEHVRPGGHLVFDHYATGLVHRLRLAQVYRARMVHMDPDTAMDEVTRLYEKWAPRHRDARSVFRRKYLTLRSPIVYFGSEWPQLNDEQRREWSLLDTYDALTDTYKHRRSVRQVERMLTGLPLDQVSVRMSGHVVLAHARKVAHGPSGSISPNSDA